MLITSQTPEEQEIRNDQNRQILSLTTQIYIRNQFNKAITSMEAESWITIAKEQGLIDVAIDMENDLRFELEIA